MKLDVWQVKIETTLARMQLRDEHQTGKIAILRG